MATKSFPRDFLYLKDQLRRASLSVVLQIAEGSAKFSDKEFNRFLKIGLGSASEVASGLEVACESGLIDQNEFQKLVKQCEVIAKQLGGFSKKLSVSC